MRSALLVVLGALLASAGIACGQADLDPRVAGLLESVSEERLDALLQRLVSFDTRHTGSDPDPAGRGIGAARQWIFDELRTSSPRLQVAFDTYPVEAQGARFPRDVELRNVVAVLPGRTPRRIYVTAHYDSIARLVDPPDSAGPAGQGGIHWDAPDAPAPGANDNGSGTVLTMELARVFAESGIEFDATLVFVAFAGEEQGLAGSALHAARAAAEGLSIEAVFNNDIVGNVTGGTGATNASAVRVFAEGPEDSPSRQLARHVRTAAARYLPGHRVALVARRDRFGRASDHTPFNQHGFTAVRVTEANEHYGRQHVVEDTIDGVSIPYLAQNARVNAAAVATLALAPAAPVVTSETGAPLLARGPSGYDAHVRWQASPGAAAYRVYWRGAWTQDWQFTADAGDATELVLPNVSIDDVVFGVSAIGAGGHESLVSAYISRPLPPITIRTRPTSSTLGP